MAVKKVDRIKGSHCVVHLMDGREFSGILIGFTDRFMVLGTRTERTHIAIDKIRLFRERASGGTFWSRENSASQK